MSSSSCSSASCSSTSSSFMWFFLSVQVTVSTDEPVSLPSLLGVCRAWSVLQAYLVTVDDRTFSGKHRERCSILEQVSRKFCSEGVRVCVPCLRILPCTFVCMY